MQLNDFIHDHKLWWSDDIPDRDRHERVTQVVDAIRRDQEYVGKDNLEHLRLYIKRGYTKDADDTIQMAGADPRIGINAVKSAIDTVCARVTSNKPRPMFVTQGGRWDLRQKARKLQKFMDGLLHKGKFYAKARRVFKDCAIFGTGFMKVYIEDGEIEFDRVFPGNVIVDERAAVNSKPNSYFQVEFYPVETLIAHFPEAEEEILQSNVRLTHTNAYGAITTLVRVIEAWHLPQKGRGGMHCIVLDGHTLFCEEWKHKFCPLIPIRWNELPVGFYGNGAAEDLHGLQEEIDYIMARIQTSMHVNAGAWLMKHSSDDSDNSHFTNKIGTIVEWSGQHPPQLQVNPALHQQVFDHVKWLHELVFDDTGVSQMSATSRKPKGVESGIALQTLLDVEGQRFNLVLEAWEDFAMEVSDVALSLAKGAYSGGKSEYVVKYDAGKWVDTIKWSEVNISSDDYIMKKWPTNLLRSQPAGRIEDVERMIQSGVIDSQTGFMLLDFPDVEAYQSLALASLRNILWIVDQVIYEDNYVEPKEWYDLQNGIRHMQMALARAETEGAPSDVLERGMEWIAAAQDILSPPAPPAPPADLMADPMAMDPMAAGMPAEGLVDPASLPGPAPEGGPAGNIGNIAPAGVIVPGME